MLGFDPIFRAWVDSSERLLLNALLYPAGAEIPPPGSRVAELEADAIAKGDLPEVGKHPLATRNISRDLTISVAKPDGEILRKAVRKAHPPRKVRAKGKFIRGGGMLTYTVRKAAKGDAADGASGWSRKVLNYLRKSGVSPTGLNL